MAEVFRAHTLGPHGFRRPVAIKRILGQFLEDEQYMEMFVEEARVMASLNHPNIVQLHDFDRDEDGHYFLVLEWVEGLHLADWRRAQNGLREDASWAVTAAIAIEALKGLSAAHERRDVEGRRAPVFHRDVTPHNILIGNDGVVKLMDFGLARAMDRDRITQPGTLKGKLTYLAPEVVSEVPVSAQSDIFAVGVSMWETLVGRKLFEGTPLEIVDAIKEAKVPHLSKSRPDIPDELSDIVHRALEKRPEDRWRSARKMVRALSNLLRITPQSTSARTLASEVQRLRAELLVGPVPQSGLRP